MVYLDCVEGQVTFQRNQQRIIFNRKDLVDPTVFKVVRRGREHTRLLYLDGSGTTVLVPTTLLDRRLDSGLKVLKYGIEFEFYCPRTKCPELVEKLNQCSEISFYDRHTSHGVSSSSSWVLTYDASVRDTEGAKGYELVSPPLKINEYNQVKAVLDILNELDCFVTRKCGTHVHFSFDREPLSELTNLYNSYYAWEFFFDSLVAPSRRNNNNTYCGSCVGNWLSSRYRKLNCCAYAKHKTVEIRQHQGTLSYSKITHWIRLLEAWFVNYKQRPHNKNEAFDMLGFDSITREWYVNRMTELS